MSLVKKAREFAIDFQAAVRVAKRSKTANWDGKFVTKDCRLTWNRDQWRLEELPAKGKRKLRVMTLSNVQPIISQSSSTRRQSDRLLPSNILRDAKLGAGDSFEAVKEKILSACEEASEAVINSSDEDVSWIKDGLKWYGDSVYFLEVVPENTEPFEVEGKDFTVKVSWTTFGAYSPDSDFQLSDPHYTKYEAKSPAAARKMYTTMKTDPSALKSVPWTDLSKWFDTKKIPYRISFSQWT